jgi:hypothetical protein
MTAMPQNDEDQSWRTDKKQVELHIHPLWLLVLPYSALGLFLFISLVFGGEMCLGYTSSVQIAVKALAVSLLLCGAGLILIIAAIRLRLFAPLLLLIPALFFAGLFSACLMRLYILKNPYIFEQRHQGPPPGYRPYAPSRPSGGRDESRPG